MAIRDEEGGIHNYLKILTINIQIVSE